LIADAAEVSVTVGKRGNLGIRPLLPEKRALFDCEGNTTLPE